MELTRKEAIEEINRLNRVSGLSAWSNMKVALQKRKEARKLAKEHVEDLSGYCYTCGKDMLDRNLTPEECIDKDKCLEEERRCTSCNSPFEAHHHRHITRKGIYHTSCYENRE